MEDLSNRLDRIEQQLHELTRICTEIHRDSRTTQESCARMDSHINFVNGAYTSLRAPLDFIRGRFSSGAPPMPPSTTTDPE